VREGIDDVKLFAQVKTARSPGDLGKLASPVLDEVDNLGKSASGNKSDYKLSEAL
jgi:hypothetical protein